MGWNRGLDDVRTVSQAQLLKADCPVPVSNVEVHTLEFAGQQHAIMSNEIACLFQLFHPIVVLSCSSTSFFLTSSGAADKSASSSSEKKVLAISLAVLGVALCALLNLPSIGPLSASVGFAFMVNRSP